MFDFVSPRISLTLGILEIEDVMVEHAVCGSMPYCAISDVKRRMNF